MFPFALILSIDTKCQKAADTLSQSIGGYLKEQKS